MPLPLIGLGAALGAIAVPLAVKVLAALGFGFVAYTGVGLVLDQAYDLIVDQFEAMPVEALSLLALANADKAVTMLFSAYAARAALAGLGATGVLAKFGARGVPGA